VAALYMVDHVASVPCFEATRSVAVLQPDVLVRGQEYQTLRRKTAEREKAELDRYGGELLFSSGLGGFNVLTSVDGDANGFTGARSSLLKMIERRDIKFARLDEVLSSFPGLNVAVVGDSIVDEYIFCDALGMSAEDPVIVVRPRKTKRYVGGAAIVAEHVQALGANAHFFSVIGKDAGASFLRDHSRGSGVDYHLLTDTTRPTTVKQRYIAGGKKLLRVSHLEEGPISDALGDALVAAFEKVVPDIDLVIFSDFSYGVLRPEVLEPITALARARDVTITADVQASSQVATVAKYRGVDLVTPTEREARMSLWDMDSSIVQIGLQLLRQTGDRDLIVKLGENGLVIFNGLWEKGKLRDASTEYLASFAEEVKDPMGAGDALLAASSLALAGGASVFEASILGNVAAAEEVMRMGNVPVTRHQLERRLTSLVEPILEMKV
jgi:rfaE bifunctional protein kinase chain/domain